MERTGVAHSLVQSLLRIKRRNPSPIPTPVSDIDLFVRSAYRELVGRRTGIVRQLQNCAPNGSDFPLKYVAGEIANPAPDSLTATMHVGGAGRDHATATIAAIGEGLERYSAGCQRGHKTIFASANELHGSHFSAEQFAPFSPRQRESHGFPFAEVTETDQIEWLAGTRLDAETLPSPQTAVENYWLPAFAVFLPYVPRQGEVAIAPGLSTGLACSSNLANAILSGILEVIERDALAAMWLLRKTPQRISRGFVNEFAGDLLPPHSDQRLQAFDVTSDIEVPTVLVLDRWPDESLPPNSRRKNYGEILSVGTACHPNPIQALRKAITEAGQGRVYIRQLQQLEPNWTAGKSLENLHDFAAHARFYTARPELVETAFRFLLESERLSNRFDTNSDSTENGSGDFRSEQWSSIQLRELTYRLNSRGHTTAWIDLTPQAAESIPLKVVRVAIPSLLPLHGHHHLAYESHPRLLNQLALLDQLKRLNPSSDNTPSSELSPYPHPFP